MMLQYTRSHYTVLIFHLLLVSCKHNLFQNHLQKVLVLPPYLQTNVYCTHRRMQDSMVPGCYGVLNDEIK